MIELQPVLMALSSIFALCVLLGVYRLIEHTPQLEWWHLISSRAIDGTQYVDINKIGQNCGIFLCVWIPIAYVNSPKMEGQGLALLMAATLAYLGGVSGYAAMLRSKQGAGEVKGNGK